MGMFDEFNNGLQKEYRTEEESGLHLRFFNWDDDPQFPTQNPIDYQTVEENYASRNYQIAKIEARIKYLKEVKEPENNRKLAEAAATLNSILLLIDAMTKILKVFGIDAITWNGFDISKLGNTLNILVEATKSYLETKKQYYELIPTKNQWGSSRPHIDYDTPEIPDDVKNRHRDIGFLRATVLNDNRNKTYRFLGKVSLARNILKTATQIISQISPQFKEFYDEVTGYINDVNEIRNALDELRLALIIVGPVVARAASPAGDGVIATLFASLVSHISTILTWLDKILMYLNYFIFINNDYEDYLKDCRANDTFVHRYGSQL